MKAKKVTEKEIRELDSVEPFDEFDYCEICGGSIVDGICSDCGYNPFLLLNDD